MTGTCLELFANRVGAGRTSARVPTAFVAKLNPTWEATRYRR
jgi:hypothetical protein